MTKRIGLLQLSSVLGDQEENIKKVETILSSSKEQLDFLALPEFFNVGYNLDYISGHIEELSLRVPGKITERLGKIAKTFGTAIIANVIERDPVVPGKYFDTSFIVDKAGKYVGKYRKMFIHPTETFLFSPGTTAPVFELEGLKIALSVCYDHAFPELYRLLALKGAEVIFISSAIPYGFEHLIHVRTRARAQDNQLFVGAVNAVGKLEQDKRAFCGESMVVNPKGEIIASLNDEPDKLLICEIETNDIVKERLKEPSLKDPIMYSWYSRILNTL